MNTKKNISVCFTADQFKKYADRKSTVVVIDLLRATSVISTAFMEGVKAIIPVQTLDEALSYKGKDGYIVAAERNAKPIEGFDFGNSPFHYINADVEGKTLVLTTTNGTKAIYNAREHKVITASYINIDAVAKHLIDEHNDVILLCSGWKGVFNLEDPIFAGSLAKLLLKSDKYESNCDSMFASIQLLKSAEGDLFNYLSDSSHRRRLKSLNLEDDTRFCLSPPIKSDIIPILKGDKLVVL
ncbi:MAG: 2-phosphosulfolactate phosphatase [Flavobacteriales bacterium]|jgi:2-phosphosulfolactate phosphatase|nr:2-phosphosulfolactate phosphatase [Flavobacteriales bacterium]MBT4882086.1 2-phosphosulfolactate phosphatase [Flavobacteriales bacterium]